MARHASTYRQARRQAWKETDLPWIEFNGPSTAGAQQHRWKLYGSYVETVSGPVEERYIGSPASRSKYIPHIGAKQIA